jgi:hypothetical protein
MTKELPTDHFLNDNWILYFHDPFDPNWEKPSYKEICRIDTIEKFWLITNLLEDKIEIGMFFLFREHIFPLWDDEFNATGGSLSMKILKTDSFNCWTDIAIKLLSENLLKDDINKEFAEEINGISISPKKTFCIIKIWLKFKNLTEPTKFKIMEKYHGKLLFKPHCET